MSRGTAHGAFVRSLPAGGEPVDESLALTPEVQADLDARLSEMRDARDAAAVSGQRHLVTGARR